MFLAAAGRAVGALAGAANAANNLAGSWETTFSRWFPDYKNRVKVTVQGKRETPMRQVLHSALCVAFGVCPEIKQASKAINVTVDHRNNGVEIEFATNIGGLLGILGPILAEGHKLPDLIAETFLSWIGVKEGSPVGDAYAKALKLAMDRTRALGAGDIWNMANRNGHISGGVAPSVFLPADEKGALYIPAPAASMIGDVFLTKRVADNPQITPAAGTKPFEGYPAPYFDPLVTFLPATADLATMVAAALMDPGIRNSVPATDSPPKPGATELGVPR